MVSKTVLEKTAFEERRLNFDFTKYLETGETVTGTPTIVLSPTGDVNDLAAGAPALVTPKVQAVYTKGIVGNEYDVRCRVDTSAGQKLELHGRLRIVAA